MNQSSLQLADLHDLVPAPGPADHKYSRGVVGLAVGSTRYPGAAVLASEAALSTGVGMVRLLSDETVEQLVLSTCPEVVVGPGRVDAVVVGSGIAESDREAVTGRMTRLDIDSSTPVIVDAAALLLTPELPGAKIMTPHQGELDQVAAALGISLPTPLETALEVASRWEVVVYVKGHTSTVCTPDGVAYELAEATPWLASAGTGDVLAGIMGGLCALNHSTPTTTSSLARLAAGAGVIHAAAAKRASESAGDGVPGPLTASAVAKEVAPIIARLARA